MSGATLTVCLDAEPNPEHVLQVHCGSTVRFSLPPTSGALADPRPALRTNYPVEGEAFVRGLFREIESEPRSVDEEWVVKLEVTLPGCFEYELVSKSSNAHRASHFTVLPKLTCAGELISIPSVVCQTVLTKCLGPANRWLDVLKDSSALRYTALHFSPVQALGESGSCYSLEHQHHLTDQLLPEDADVASLTHQERESRKRERLQEIIRALETDHGLLSLCDVVWNHTASSSPWLREHPEAGYSLENSPHLKGAYELDRALQEYSKQLAHYDEEIVEEEDVDRVMHTLKRSVVPQLRLWEYYVVNVDEAVYCFRKHLHARGLDQDTPHVHHNTSAPTLEHVLEPEACRDHDHPNQQFTPCCLYDTGTGERFHTRVRLSCALALFGGGGIDGCGGGLSKREIRARSAQYRRSLERFNLSLYEACDRDLERMFTNVRSAIRYLHLEPTGPRRQAITQKEPLLEPYFTQVHCVNGEVVPLANSGWVWDADPSFDFAGPERNAYFVRDLIVWSDCVKLRYGRSESDSPWLWKHMASYTAEMAALFHGLRLDNCHTTPLWVATHMLDAARSANPNVFVFAELFTSSPVTDAAYFSQLGIHALVREAMHAHDAASLANTLHRCGGDAAGSFANARSPAGGFGPPPVICYDGTHDNETPNQKRSAVDALPNAAAVSMCACAMGSSRGYDELLPERIDVVHETRLYATDTVKRGIGTLRVKLNELHRQLGQEGFTEVHVHEADGMVAISRHHPETHEAYVTMCLGAFSQRDIAVNTILERAQHPPHVTLSGEFKRTVLSARLFVPQQHHQRDPQYITGLSSVLTVREVPEPEYHELLLVAGRDVSLPEPSPGTVVIIQSTPAPSVAQHLVQLRAFLEPASDQARLTAIAARLSLLHLNVALYRCGAEEASAIGAGVYEVPGCCAMPYCGIAGFFAALQPVRKANALGHPICDNLRAGDWMMDYTSGRLRCYGGRFVQLADGLSELADWLDEAFSHVRAVDRYLVPKYFTEVIEYAYSALTKAALSQLGGLARNETSLSARLLLGSVQMYGLVPSSALLSPPRAEQHEDDWWRYGATLAAGLPHFAEGYMRSWGRDTFIALRGLMLIAGRQKEALEIILNFASCVRHGLVPNLIGNAHSPRFNARDASWWFLQALQDYCEMFAGGATSAEAVRMLNETTVVRRFPMDLRAEDQEVAVSTSLADIVQEIVQRHATGIHFTEWEAGPQIDPKMRADGFKVDVWLDHKSGLVFGGSVLNCGTWMDKMGESERGGNFGVPATPRCGANVEIAGLVKSTVRWLRAISQRDDTPFPYHGVQVETCGDEGRRSLLTVSFETWDERLREQFEHRFYVPLDKSEDAQFDIRKELVQQRGIYKDTVGAPESSNYELRPNVVVAMAVAPELFTPSRARAALEKIESRLIAPCGIGMRTLDPEHPLFRPHYTNTDGDDRSTAGGFNYHQGPEWVWLYGYFLRAKQRFIWNELSKEDRLRQTLTSLHRHERHLRNSPWLGLTELTNENGSPCLASCPVQAWSHSTLIDAIYDASL